MASDAIMTAGYALVFLVILHHPLRQKLHLMLFSCAFAAIYNVAYRTAVWYIPLDGIALFVRLLAPLEAVWNVIEVRKDCRFGFAGLCAALSLGIYNPNVLAWGYLPIRNLSTLSVAGVCLMVSLGNHFEPFTKNRLLSVHIELQTAWMILHALTSASYYFLTTAQRWDTARWFYVAGSVVIFGLYHHFFFKSPVGQVAGQVGRLTL